MAVVTSISSPPKSSIFSPFHAQIHSNLENFSKSTSSLYSKAHTFSKFHLIHTKLHPLSSLSSSPSVFFLLACNFPRQKSYRGSKNCNGSLLVRAYMEKPNSVSSFASKVIGALPVVGLIARIFNDEGGFGGDIIDFAEFRRRVGKKCSVNDSRAFYEFQGRRGRAGDPLYVLLCCWLAAVGAGLLKSEQILEGVARLRISNDIEFEEQNFFAIMTDAKQRRTKLKIATPEIPMEIRSQKALEAIYVCCFGGDPIEDEDERLLCIMLSAVFPTVGRSEMDKIISAKVKQIAEGDTEYFFEPKSLPKDAVQLQMKDLDFLKQNNEK